jgi:hypothetical protein
MVAALAPPSSGEPGRSARVCDERVSVGNGTGPGMHLAHDPAGEGTEGSVDSGRQAGSRHTATPPEGADDRLDDRAYLTADRLPGVRSWLRHGLERAGAVGKGCAHQGERYPGCQRSSTRSLFGWLE